MAEEKQVDHGGNTGLLAKSKQIDLVYEMYRKNSNQEEGDLVGPLQTLESLVSDGDDIVEGSFMTATPQAIEYAVKGYQERNKKARETAVKESGSNIAENYIETLEEVLGKAVGKISSQKGFDELSPGDQAKVMEPQLYMQIAAGLTELNPNDKAIDDYEKLLLKLSKVKEESEKRDATLEYLEQRGLGHMRYAMDPRESSQRAESRLYRLLAKKLIKKDEEGNYHIDRKAFQKLYGTEDNYKKIAFSLEASKSQQYKQAA